ncbi:MAG: hypothetical protein ABSG88_10605 [Bradyrhizobium sp.]
MIDNVGRRRRQTHPFPDKAQEDKAHEKACREKRGRLYVGSSVGLNGNQIFV